MPFIQTVHEEQAEGLVNDQYQAALKTLGYVPNYLKAFSLRPEIYEAWTHLTGTLRSRMKLRRYVLVTFAAALGMKCTY